MATSNRTNDPSGMHFIDPSALQPFEFVVKRKSFSEFLEAYLDLPESSDAPTPPWVLFTQLPSLQQKSDFSKMKGEHTADHQQGKRKPRVVFDDEAQTSSSSTRGATTTDSGSAHRQAVAKKMKSILDSLHVHPSSDAESGDVVRQYFAVKSLVEFLPMQSLIANTNPSYFTTPVFITKAKEIVDHIASSNATQHANHSARFKRLALRRAGGSGGAEGAVIGHHYGARHAFQLFLRSLLAASKSDTQAEAANIIAKQGAAAGGARLRQQQAFLQQQLALTAATRELQSFEQLGRLLANADRMASDRNAVLGEVERETGLPPRVITALHLQSKGLQKDKRLLGKGTDAVGSSADGASSVAKRSMSLGQLSNHSSQKDLKASAQSSSAYDSADNSDTKSVRSAATTATSGSHATQQVMPHVCPPWLLPQSEFWISLKGVVFRINASPRRDTLRSPQKNSCDDNASKKALSVPLGRALYYRLVLLPVFSGRDCTRALAWQQMSCSSMDFLGVEEYINAWRKKISESAVKASENGSVLAGPANTWPAEVKENINKVFSVFLTDFDVVGELEHSESLWF